jgi:hypothetical protein
MYPGIRCLKGRSHSFLSDRTRSCAIEISNGFLQRLLVLRLSGFGGSRLASVACPVLGLSGFGGAKRSKKKCDRPLDFSLQLPVRYNCNVLGAIDRRELRKKYALRKVWLFGRQCASTARIVIVHRYHVDRNA